MKTLDRISIDPNICMSQPTIKNTRITLRVILKMLSNGANIEEVNRAYPELEEEDVKQAMKYKMVI